MKIKLTSLVGLSIAVLLGLALTSNAIAQGKAEKKAEQANIQGTVQNMSKDTSTITVRTTGTATRQVVFDAKTKFLYGHSDNNKPGAVAQVKDNYYISCAGTFNAKNQLQATECVYREAK